MPTKLNSDSFLSIVRQSGLVEESQLSKFWTGFEQTGKNAQDPELIARELVTSNLLSKWQIDKLLQGKHKGFFLGKYKLISLLGSGGMSAVYLAEHTLMRRRVAIKVLPQSRIEDSSYLERFHREAQAVASLDHPNIMRAYDVDQEGKVHFLVMEYIEGQSLLELVGAKGPLPFIAAAEYVRQSAVGLGHAHDEGMIHRDIKPGNILVDKRGVVKILDMGLAMFFDPSGKDDEQASLTIQHDERVLGTADYLSPEQALNSHNVDIRTDIYSLGCTFYYILTGHPPFPEGSLAQRLLYHQTRQPEIVEKDRPEMPPGLSKILRKMMEKKLDDRYQTAKEVQDALAKWLVEFGDAEWREKNSMLVASHAGASGIYRKNTPPVATVVPIARPVNPPTPAAPVANPVVVVTPSKPSSKVAKQTKPPSGVPGPAAQAPVIARPDSNRGAAVAPPAKPNVVPDSFPDFAAGVPAGNRPSNPAVLSPAFANPAPPPQSTAAPSGFADFGSFDPSEQTFEYDTNTVIKASSASTIKQKARQKKNQESFEKLVQNKKVQLAAAGGVIAVFLILTISYYARIWSPKKVPVKTNAKAVEYVVGGPKGKFKTIAAALEAVKESGGSKPIIRVAGSKTYTERLDFSGLPAGVTLLAVEALGPTIASTGPEPLLDISNVRGLNIEGFNLDADGKEIGVRLRGKLPQLGISGCSLTGFTKQGIAVSGATGSTTDRVLLDNVKLKAGKPTAAGIVFSKGATIPAFVSVDGCRLLGPMSAGIVIETDCEDIKLVKNILAETGVGMRFVGEKRNLKNVGMANNAFYKLKQGIVFASMPGNKSESVGFFNNLFAQIEGPDLVIEKGFNQSDFAGLSGLSANNWTDKATLDPNLVIFSSGGQAGVKYQFLSLEPEHPGFLAPSPTSPQRDAPSSGIAEPYVGAVGSQ